MTELLSAAGPRHRWTVGEYSFALYPVGWGRWRWECTARGRGVGHCRTPVGAFIALRRFLKELS